MNLSSWMLSVGPHDASGVRVSLSSEFSWPLASDGLGALLVALAPTAQNPLHVEFSVAVGDGRWFDACADALKLSTGGAFTIRFELPPVQESTP
jgi:hypothetical protein